MWRDSIKKRKMRYKYLISSNEQLSEPIYYLEKASGKSFSELKQNTEQDVIKNTAIYVLAPVICSYVLWVLKDALKRERKRLYFLARDGYLMYETAKIITESLKLPIECRYLSCSRYSTRIPAFHLEMDSALEYICRGGIDVTLEKVLDRAGLSQEQKDLMYGELKEFSKSEVIPYARLASLKDRLKKSKYFIKNLIEISKDKFVACEGYLQKEGLFDDIDFSFVDSGWTGSMQNTIALIINSKKKKNEHKMIPDGYYFGLYELPKGIDKSRYHCYYFSPDSGLKRKIKFSNCLFECIYSAPHGMTLGYDMSSFEPVYSKINEFNRSFILNISKYIRAYARQLAVSNMTLKKIDDNKNRNTTSKLLDTFMGEPSKHEVEVFGILPFSDDVLDTNIYPVAAFMTQRQLKANYPLSKILTLMRENSFYLKESAWYEGSAVRSGKDVKKHLAEYRIYKVMLYMRKALAQLRNV